MREGGCALYAFYERRSLPFELTLTENLSFYPHIHGHVELVYARVGEMALTVGDSEKVLAPGELAIVFPNTVHSYRTERRSGAQLLIFDAELVKEFAAQLGRYQPERPFLGPERIHPDALFALDALARRETDEPGLLNGYLLVLVGRVLEALTLVRRPPLMDEDLLHRLLAHLDEHFRSRLTLDEIGASLGASRYQISRCFSHRIGCNFNAYLNAMRAGYAARLLAESPVSVAEAGYEAGFDSLSTFYRAFKANYGTSPKAFRDRPAP